MFTGSYENSVFGNTQFLSADICKQIYKRNHIVVQKILNCQRCTSGKNSKYYGGIAQSPHVAIYSIYIIHSIHAFLHKLLLPYRKKFRQTKVSAPHQLDISTVLSVENFSSVSYFRFLIFTTKNML